MKTAKHPRFPLAAIPRSTLIALSLLAAGASLPAQSKWNGAGADNLWTNPLNWEGGVAPVSSAATAAQMQGTAGRYSVTVDTPFTLRSLVFNSAVTPGAYTLSGSALTLSGDGSGGNPDSTIILQNNSTATQTINNGLVLGGPGRIDAAAGNFVLNGGIDGNSQAGLRFTAGSGKSITIAGVISNISTNSVSYNDTVSGGGHFTITGANTYTAGTNLFGGTYHIGTNALSGVAGAFGNSTGQIMVGAANRSVTILQEGAFTIGRNLRLSSAATSVTLGGGTAHTSTYSGYIYLGEVNGQARAVTLTAETGGRVRIGTGSPGVGGLLRATNATGSGDSVEKIGAGIVSIEQGTSNTYSGTTTVTAGTLLINGTLASGGGTVTVRSAAELGGAGIINRFTNIEAGGILSAGDFNASGTSQVGTLAFGAGLSLSDTSVVRFDLGSVSDLIAVTGNLALDGVLQITGGTGFGAGAYTLFTYSGTLADGGLAVGIMPSGYTGSIDLSQSGSVILNVAAIPEPGTVALCGAGLLILGLARFRRRVL